MGLLAWSAWWASPTFDEPFHLLRGLNYWWLGDMRAYYAEPPLFDAIASLPAAVTMPWIDLEALRGWPALGKTSPAFLEADYATIRPAMQLGRAVVLSVYASMMLLSYGLCLRIWGMVSARMVLVILCFEPLLLAHGHLLTTDLGLSAGLLATASATIYYLRTPGWRPFAWLVAAISFCTLTKISGAAVGPMVAAIVLLRASIRGPRFRAHQRARRYLAAGLQMLAAGLAVILAINLAFRFDRSAMSVHEILQERDARKRLMHSESLQALPKGLRIPLPYMYIVSLVHVHEESRAGRRVFFNGTWRDRGTPRYYPTLLIVQGSPTLLALLILAFFLLVRRGKLSETSQVIAAFAVLWLLLTMTSRVNIGFRHALPIIPLLSLLGARAGACFLADPYLRRAHPMVYVILALAPVTGFLCAPRYLGFFNPMAGSRARGHTINLLGEDWGQDLRDLVKYATEHSGNPLYYHEYRPGLGHSELRYLGLSYEELQCGEFLPVGTLAVHATVVARGRCFPELKTDQASASINDHILLFDR